MIETTGTSWGWIWPDVGATPVSQGLDSEMFDRTDYPYSETFVREAIQNSLDARLDPEKPVTVRFSFHHKTLGPQKEFLAQAFSFRERAGLPDLPEWKKGEATWLVVEDFNSKGLGGDLQNRTGDFWNYWLNFGLSNKDGSGRGGRGIGRVTFLIASKIQTVIGYTRRQDDGQTAACGMCVLRAMLEGKRFLSTHAYLAQEEDESIFVLHGEPMHEPLKHAFNLTGYESPEAQSGFALVIPYPHDELSPDGILASTIEHFAPAIISGSLVVEVDGQTLDRDTIAVIAARVADNINAESIRKDVARYLSLILAGLELSSVQINAGNSQKINLDDAKGTLLSQKLQETVEDGDVAVLEISMPLEKDGRESAVSLRAVIAKTPSGSSPIDRLFREGMSLPEVKARNPGEHDLVLLVDDQALATYLNFCEGKAHLDLLESKDTREKLTARGYTGSLFRVKRFVKSLPVDLRLLLTPDITDPDANVFDAFFSIPSEYPGKKTGREKREEPPVIPPVEPPPPRISPLAVIALDDGLCVKANPAYPNWPINVSVRVAYADGSRKPAWSEYDFRLEDLLLEFEECEVSTDKNRIRALSFGPDSVFRVTGFDTKRELDTSIRAWKDA